MKPYLLLPLSLLLLITAGCAANSDQENIADSGGSEAEAVCGPQAPRDISVAGGDNTVEVPDGETPNLCNVHFHRPFEHAGFTSAPETAGPSGDPVCKDVDDGDQVEFHWVYTNCDLSEPPKEGLGNCVCDREDLALRVFAKAYVVGSEGEALAQPIDGLVRYKGSTTGPKYNNEVCSPALVNWEVHPEVAMLSRASLGEFCSANVWGEDHAHEIRVLVDRADWLAPFTPPM